MLASDRVCVRHYDPANEDLRPFGPQAIRNDTRALNYRTAHAWMYTQPTDSTNGRLWASQATYNGGGFIANLDINKNISEAIIRELKDNLWIDRQTRAVFVEFTIYNPNVDLFGYVTLVAEFLPGGGATHFAKIQIIQAYGMGFFSMAVYICGVGCLIYFLISFALVVRDALKRRSAFLMELTTWLELTVLITVLIATSLFAVRMSRMSTVLAQMNSDRHKYVQFGRVAGYDSGYRYTIAFLNCLGMVKLVVLMQINKRVANLGGILRACMRPLSSLSVCLMVFLIAYSSWAHLTFQSVFPDFQSLPDTMLSLISASLGAFDIQGLVETNPGSVLPGLFYCSYMALMNWTLLNIMVAVICESQASLSNLDAYSNAYIENLIRKVWPSYGITDGQGDKRQNTNTSL